MKFMLGYNHVLISSREDYRQTPRVIRSREDKYNRDAERYLTAYRKNGEPSALNPVVSKEQEEAIDNLKNTLTPKAPSPIRVTFGGQQLNAKTFEFKGLSGEVVGASPAVSPRQSGKSTQLHQFLEDYHRVQSDMINRGLKPNHTVIISKTMADALAVHGLAQPVNTTVYKDYESVAIDMNTGATEPVGPSPAAVAKKKEGNWPGKGKPGFRRR